MGKNRCDFIGNLAADGELRWTQSGVPVVNFRLACNRNVYSQQTKKSRQEVDFIPMVFWGKRAESMHKKGLLNKGQGLAITGRFSTRSWEDKDGQKRYTSEIVVGRNDD